VPAKLYRPEAKPSAMAPKPSRSEAAFPGRVSGAGAKRPLWQEVSFDENKFLQVKGDVARRSKHVRPTSIPSLAIPISFSLFCLKRPVLLSIFFVHRTSERHEVNLLIRVLGGTILFRKQAFGHNCVERSQKNRS